jgi:hypothetical protein
VKLQSTAFIVGEVERLSDNTKPGAFGERPFERVSRGCDCCCGCDDDLDSEVVSRDAYEALLALAVKLAERVKDGRLRKARGTL